MTGPTIQYPLVDGQSSQVLRELRERAPVATVRLWNGRPAWLVTRHADALRALTDPRLSTDATNPNFPSMNPSQVVPNDRGGLARMRDDRHRVVRNLVASKFTFRAVQQWRPISEQIVAEQLAVLLQHGPPADLVTAFGLPVPLRMVCRLLGVPERDVDYVQRQAQMFITRAYESSQPALRELRAFVDRLVQHSEQAPGDDLVGQLITEHLRPDGFTRQELADLSMVILVAGHTTTASTITLSVLSLLEEPDRYRALHEDPSLVEPMVEEFLRLQTVVTDGAPRVAKEDLVLGGVTIRAGDAVVISLTSANQDEQVFTDPEVLQLQCPRADVHRHIAFGWGAHRCLGQHLARMELQIALATLARTIPTLRLAVPAEQLRYAQREKHVNGVYKLLVSW
ncbi:MAG: cytochrome P450 [Micromonosporaceae bacterium]|nr:cytochrome P450 [Micromonosporaceae bacterium]